jgi:hypothetical protein
LGSYEEFFEADGVPAGSTTACPLNVPFDRFKHRLRVRRLRHRGRLVVNPIVDIRMILAKLLQQRDPTNPKRVWYSGVLSSRMGFIRSRKAPSSVGTLESTAGHDECLIN